MVSRDRKLPQLQKNHEDKKADCSHSTRGVDMTVSAILMLAVVAHLSCR